MSKTIKGVIVPLSSSVPVYTDIPLRSPTLDEITVKVLASGFHRLVKARALGQHYSVNPGTTSQTPIGVDGVGYIDGTDELVFFASAKPDFGSCAQYINIDKRAVVPFPKGVNSEEAISRVAALLNGLMSSLFAISGRIPDLRPGPVIAILGVTGTAGQLAIQSAKKVYEASKVIGIGRSFESLKELKSKEPLLDTIISLEDTEELITQSKVLSEVDVVLDYLYGPPATKIINSALKSRIDPTRALYWVQIGQSSGVATIEVPALALRAFNFNLLGSGFGPLTMMQMGKIFKQCTELLAKGDIIGDYTDVPVEKVAEVWDLPWSSSRICFRFSH